MSDIYNAPSPEVAIDAIASAAPRRARAGAGLGPEELRAAVVQPRGRRLAGGLRAARGRAARAARAERRAAGRQRRARRAARRLADWTGVSVVSGTYNAIGARHPDGRVFHLGFWPDGAGGRHLAKAGLRAVYHEALVDGPADGDLRAGARAVRRARRDRPAARCSPAAAGSRSTRPTGSRPPCSTSRTRATRSRRRSSRGWARSSAARRAPAPASSTCRSRARRSCSRAASSAIRPTGSPTPRWPSCRAPSPSATRRRRSRARCCWRSTALGVDRRRRHRRGRPPLRPPTEERSMGGIALEGVSKVFPGGVVAVDDVDLEIGDGEFMVLVGPSGCGKSTLLRMIAGLEGVSGGTIRIGDQRRDRARRRAAATSPWSSRTTRSTRTCACGTTSPSRSSCGGRRSPRMQRAGRLRRRRARAQGARRPQAGRAVGRAAPARGDRARDGARAAGLPDGRAALQPRREAARRDARGARAAARPARRPRRSTSPTTRSRR